MQFEVKDYQTMQKSIADFCRFLTEYGISSDIVFDCRLVATELLSNVLRHARAEASLHGRVEDGYVVVTVQASRRSELPKNSVCSDVYAEHGRGLFLIDSVCTERITTSDGDILVRIKING